MLKIEKLIRNICKKFKISDKYVELIIQIFKFGIVGGIATIIDFLVFLILSEILKIDVLIANTVSFSVSVIYNYLASVKYVFKVDKNKSKNFIIFIITAVSGLVISNIIISICRQIKLYNIISKLIATVFVMIFNFVTRKKFLEKIN